MWRRAVSSAPVLPQAIAARRRTFPSEAGRISYYEDDGATGVPCVLLHGVGPSACAYEVRPIFDGLRAERPVFAADLPGYGFSEHRSGPNTRDDYVRFVEDLLTDVRRHRGRELDVVAIGTTGELAARALAANPELARSLAIVAPTGFGRRTAAWAGATERVRHIAERVIGVPLVGRAIHRAVTSRPALHALVARRVSTHLDEGLVSYAHLSARQPSARVASLAAMLGGLEDPWIVGDVLDALRVPVCFLHGDVHGAVVYDIDALVARHADFHRVHVPGAGQLPHIERPFDTTEALRSFWRLLPTQPALRLMRGGRAGTGHGARGTRESKPWR